ncbi:unnamed protein product [Dibothriocephalus latus]|uniref:Secreted protein n=1 Tax=Dibothriocephalus latus TaxID=60516 RepID=A0A3P7NLJ4_DIBLA|nr:unnamed protein product [Dibothriocephalus latus]
MPKFHLFAFLFFSDVLELYKACVTADQDAALNPYFRLFFRHQDSMLMAYLCRTVICKWAGWKDCEMGKHVSSCWCSFILYK